MALFLEPDVTLICWHDKNVLGGGVFFLPSYKPAVLLFSLIHPEEKKEKKKKKKHPPPKRPSCLIIITTLQLDAKSRFRRGWMDGCFILTEDLSSAVAIERYLGKRASPHSKHATGEGSGGVCEFPLQREDGYFFFSRLVGSC